MSLYDRQKETVRQLQEAESVRNGFTKVAADLYEGSLKKLDEVRTAIARKGTSDRALEITEVEKVTASYREQLVEKLKLAGPGGLKSADLNTFNSAKSLAVLAAALQDDQTIKERAIKTQEEIDKNNDKILAERFKKSTEFSIKERELSIETVNSAFAYEQNIAQQSRDQQLRGLEAINAQTLAEKVAVEQAKGNIEVEFIARSAALSSDAIDRERDKRIEAAYGFYQEQGPAAATAYWSQVGVIEADATEKHRQLQLTSEDQIQAARVYPAINSSRLIIDEDRKIFDTFKSEANGIFDALFTKGGNVFKALGKAAETAILTPIKDIFSNQIAAGLTSAITGQTVTLKNQQPVGSTGLAKFAAAISLGAVPVFGGPGITQRIPQNPTAITAAAQQSQYSLEQSDHLGNVVLTNDGAVPVFLVIQPTSESSASTPVAAATSNISITGGSSTVSNLLSLVGAASTPAATSAVGSSGAGSGAVVRDSIVWLSWVVAV